MSSGARTAFLDSVVRSSDHAEVPCRAPSLWESCRGPGLLILPIEAAVGAVGGVGNAGAGRAAFFTPSTVRTPASSQPDLKRRKSPLSDPGSDAFLQSNAPALANFLRCHLYTPFRRTTILRRRWLGSAFQAPGFLYGEPARRTSSVNLISIHVSWR